ncbi:hypothetical protein C8R45DRAFT_1103286 [Mycena sanguinolenta]|nr:hypothetical protein C8R45DRAFT_1103286 [Mycena sanguinolenta]
MTLNSPPDPRIKAITRRRQVHRKQALRTYYDSHAEILREKARERMKKARQVKKDQGDEIGIRRAQADFVYREKQRRRKHIEMYGPKSFLDFYLPLVDFFGSDNLSGVTLVDETCKERSENFRLSFTEEHEEARRKFRRGQRVKLVITDESIASRLLK